MQIKYIRSLYVNNLGSRNMGRGKNTQTHTKYSIMMLHQQNEKQMWGNEPCKQSRINSITSHLHHASAQEDKTKVFVTFKIWKRERHEILIPCPIWSVISAKIGAQLFE